MHQSFHEDIVPQIKNEIANANDNEVLFFGWTDENNRVIKVEIVARGNKECVAIPLQKSFLPDVIIHNHPNGSLSPSSQDMNIASFIANKGVGFIIVNNDLTQQYVVVEPVFKKKKIYLDSEKLSSLLSEQGPFRSTLQVFEERSGQRVMTESVCESFNNDKIMLIEAGTGIGKSIAYLVPAIEWSIINKERVIVSTNTINLQEQLLYKDIPNITETLDADFSYILMKGRGNYICLSRIFEIQQDLFSFIDDEELSQFDQILQWINRTDDGSLSDLSFMPKPNLWEKINSQSETCSGAGCRYFSRCFLNNVKRKAITANIIVTNHYYLLADACLFESGTSILPSYDRVIFDEAHNLEDAATSFFTEKITLSFIMRVLNHLYSDPKKNKGYLLYLSKKGVVRGQQIDKVLDEVTVLKSSVLQLFESIDVFLRRADLEINYSSPASSHTVIEVNEETKNLPLWESNVIQQLGMFYRQCTALSASLFQLHEELAGKEDERSQKQIDGFISRINEIIHAIDIFLNDEERNYVRWIEKRREVGIVVSLIEVGSMLNELIFQRLKSGILTSATLTVDNTFYFMLNRLSLHGMAEGVKIESPFSYDEQMAILIPTDVLLPNHPDYSIDLGLKILKIVKKTKGKAFVLFTAYKTLNDVYDRVREELEEDGLVVFKQGNDLRKNLLNNFKLNIHSILFGTESFWEGVDAPGETLECVIITKLPFKVPTEPVIKARLEEIRARGGNPFMEYSLPLAVIKMKQGIGRLIRKKTDMGIVVILDSRLIYKSYGSVFINSLPGGGIFSGNLTDVLENVDRFVSNH
jgi:ATP-dependent DNA helicase DinG